MTWFNSDAVEPDNGGFAPLPNGEYRVCIIEAGEGENKNRNGRGLNLKLEVVEGEYKGRFLFQYIVTQHTTEKAQTIGLAKLSALCRATGKTGNLSGPQDLINAIGTIKVTVVKDDYKGGDALKNEISAWVFAKPEAPKPAPTAQPSGQASGQAW